MAKGHNRRPKKLQWEAGGGRRAGQDEEEGQALENRDSEEKNQSKEGKNKEGWLGGKGGG